MPELGSGGGEGDSGNARKKTFFFFIEAFPKGNKSASLIPQITDVVEAASLVGSVVCLTFQSSLVNCPTKPTCLVHSDVCICQLCFITNRKLRNRKTQARAICEAFSIFPVSKRAPTERETKTKPIFPSGAKFGLNYSSLKRTKSNSELNTE